MKLSYRANRNFVLVENPVNPSTSGSGDTRIQFYFPDQPLLYYRPTFSLVVYTPGVVSLSGLSGLPLVSYANMQQATLWIFSQDIETGIEGWSVMGKPLLELNYIDDGSSAFVYDMPMMAGQIIYWDKSYIQVKNPVANGTEAQVWQLGVFAGLPLKNNS